MNVNKIFNPAVRRWIYGICIALVPVLVYFKLLPPEASPVILPLILAILNIQADPSGTVTTYDHGEHGR